jgi:hypothetical protein
MCFDLERVSRRQFIASTKLAFALSPNESLVVGDLSPNQSRFRFDSERVVSSRRFIA